MGRPTTVPTDLDKVGGAVMHAGVSRLVAGCSLVLAAIVGITVAGIERPADAQTTEKRQLEQARQRIAELNDEIDAAEVAAQDADAELENADAMLREAEAVVNDVAAQVEDQRESVADAERRYQQVVAEAETIEAAFADRVAQIYKQGPTMTFETLLASEQAEDVLNRSMFLQQISAGDRVDLDALQASRAVVNAERERFEAERARLEQLLAEEKEFLAEVAELRERRALRAADAREQVRALEAEQDDLEADQEELEQLIREKEQAERERQAAARRRAERQRRAQPPSGGGGSGSASASGYGWPICAPVTSEYGPRWGRMHRGIDLGAGSGTPIGAAKAGSVIYAGWQGGYGQIVLISHGDGVVTAYAHMSRIGVSSGASVSRGQTIGYVGSTGNSTGPHLHLETRVNGSAVNPRQYLSGGGC